MKVLVTGAGGQLGSDVVKEAAGRAYEVIAAVHGPSEHDFPAAAESAGAGEAVHYVQMDITDRDAVIRIIEEANPDVIIHCAAWTDVDAAEEKANRAQVDLINRAGTENLARAAKAADAKMIYISTDYVFDGQGNRPRKPEERSGAPLNRYGKSKLDGELAVAGLLEKYYIVRVAWVFGRNGKNFINTMIRTGKTRDTVRVVNDQIGTPTYTVDLARLLMDMAETDRYGCYHATNSECAPGEYISWYDFCVEIYRQYGLPAKIIPVSTAEYGRRPAARPANSRLDKAKLQENGFKPLPDWKDAVSRYLKEANL